MVCQTQVNQHKGEAWDSRRYWFPIYLALTTGLEQVIVARRHANLHTYINSVEKWFNYMAVA